MSKATDQIQQLIGQCSEAEKRAVFEYLRARLPQHPLEREWGVNAEVVLSAIARSSDLTQRGVRGVIAEAIFDAQVLPSLEGWRATAFMGDLPYDFLIENQADPQKRIRVQVKLQRMKAHRPMLASEGNKLFPQDMYTVEVQKTRGGIDPATKEDTRPYHFGEFDILAVNMQPSTHEWASFMFTVSDWLVARPDDLGLVAKFQPVPQQPNEFWTDRLDTCIGWVLGGEKKRLFDIEAALRNFAERKKNKN
jgi:hypothetical protein